MIKPLKLPLKLTSAILIVLHEVSSLSNKRSISGSASVAKGLSIHMDDIFNGSMTGWFATAVPISVSFMSPYFDFFAFLIVLVMGGKILKAVFFNQIVKIVFFLCYPKINDII